ncbi:MAG TPA: hypothetical protein DCE03_00155 [Synergistaceae bacterium]|jgi:hypothetical protein|nr:MAG: Uncharacterized protein XD80_0737 [Synergistales bacterium 53_16]KUL01477.1 MAG: Uncharacterized protein XE12_1069 [Synergistales bacterium 54_9]MDN5336557.1 hypothetical protein [Synergistales bacterium]HAA46897.1 hypothetical protein [Synergistaceae bacterium]HAG22175.1 hypothetical protein [Synergistaceae bacterium]
MTSRMTTGGTTYVVARNPVTGEYQLVTRGRYPFVVIESPEPMLRLVKFVDFLGHYVDPVENGFIVACSRPYEGEYLTREGYAAVVIDVMEFSEKSGYRCCIVLSSSVCVYVNVDGSIQPGQTPEQYSEIL